MYINKGKSIAQCLTERTDYSKNPAKTNGGEYSGAYACEPETADVEFLLSKRQYRAITARADLCSIRAAITHSLNYLPVGAVKAQVGRVNDVFAGAVPFAIVPLAPLALYVIRKLPLNGTPSIIRRYPQQRHPSFLSTK